MTSGENGHRRPGPGEVLREPATPAALLDAVRNRVIDARQREHRAPATTAAVIREQLPELAAQTIADADRADHRRRRPRRPSPTPNAHWRACWSCRGQERGRASSAIPPDWFANPVDDNEYRWILNRHGHWRNLLATYSLIGERRYGAKVVQELQDWIDRVPRPPLEYDPALLEGRVSDFLDVDRPSTRLCLEDAAPPSDTSRLYASVIAPYRATEPVPALTGLSISMHGEQITCSFTLKEKAYALI